MTSVETVQGKIDSSELGMTLMHEHLFVRDLELEANFPDRFWTEDQMIDEARRTLTALKRAGVGTIVDVTVPGLGRKIGPIIEVAKHVDLNIVVATGCFVDRDLPLYFRTHGPGRRIDMAEPLEDMFLREARDGIAGSGVKPAIIKISSDQSGITPDIARVFKAAARAHLETGLSITTHSHAKGLGGLEQQSFLKNEGVDLSAVVIGHCGDTDDLDYLQKLLDGGSVIGMDRFGFSQLLDTEKRTQTVVQLCDRGYARQMILSNDANVFSSITEPKYRDDMLVKWKYEQSFFTVPEKILPNLRERGVKEANIVQMMVETPVRMLAH
jgi:phosphotriesterase-related protein